MKGKTVLSCMLAIAMAAAAPLAAEEGENASQDRGVRFSLSTNPAYFAFSAFLACEGSLFLAVPIEAEIGLSPFIALRPEAGFLVWKELTSDTPDFTLIFSLGPAWYPAGTRPRGWYISAAPGLGVAFDPGAWMILVSAEGGYQWLPWKGLLLGVGAGGRFIMMADGSGYIPLPDIRLRVGWAF